MLIPLGIFASCAAVKRWPVDPNAVGWGSAVLAKERLLVGGVAARRFEVGGVSKPERKD